MAFAHLRQKQRVAMTDYVIFHIIRHAARTQHVGGIQAWYGILVIDHRAPFHGYNASALHALARPARAATEPPTMLCMTASPDRAGHFCARHRTRGVRRWPAGQPSTNVA